MFNKINELAINEGQPLVSKNFKYSWDKDEERDITDKDEIDDGCTTEYMEDESVHDNEINELNLQEMTVDDHQTEEWDITVNKGHNTNINQNEDHDANTNQDDNDTREMIFGNSDEVEQDSYSEENVDETEAHENINEIAEDDEDGSSMANSLLEEGFIVDDDNFGSENSFEENWDHRNNIERFRSVNRKKLQ